MALQTATLSHDSDGISSYRRLCLPKWAFFPKHMELLMRMSPTGSLALRDLLFFCLVVVIVVVAFWWPCLQFLAWAECKIFLVDWFLEMPTWPCRFLSAFPLCSCSILVLLNILSGEKCSILDTQILISPNNLPLLLSGGMAVNFGLYCAEW